MNAKHVLVIEDEEILRELIAKELTKHGFIVTVAPDGRAAQQLLGEEARFDLILCDLLMPHLDGYEFLVDIKGRECYQRVPVLVLSNSGHMDDLNRAYDLGAAAVLIKAEFTPEQLMNRVKEYTAEESGGAAGG